MKAAVLHGKRDITVEDVPVPVVEPDGVIIKVKACGICGSDLHLYNHGAPGDMILGHELSGDIVSVGSNVSGVKEGERVAAITGRGCGECYWCLRGDWLRCPRMQLLGYGMDGGFAEYVSIPNFSIGKYAERLPDSVSYEVGATAEPLSVGLYAVNKSNPQPGDTAVVIGAGVIGLCAIMALKARGIDDIIVSGRRANRLKLAGECGARLVVDATVDEVVPIVQEATGGKGADLVLECAGTTDTFLQSLQLVHKGGRVGLVGLYQESIEWNPVAIVTTDVDLIGCGLRFDLPGAIELIRSGKADTKSLITHEFSLDDATKAFQTQATVPEAVKVLVKP